MLLGALQENILVLLSFSTKNALTIRNTVDLNLYGGQYRLLATRIYDYIDKYKAPPADHLPDILDDKVNSENKSERELYRDLVTSLHDAQVGINQEYVMGQLATFIKRQSLRSVAIDLTKALQRDTEESLEEADALIRRAQQSGLTLFDPGTRLSDKNRALDFLNIENQAFPTGIPELDKRGFGPTRKELSVFVANTKGGKTWWLMHLAKMTLIHRLKVLHITLEMSEARASQRYFQVLFAMSKRREKYQTTIFEKDKLDRITGFKEKEISPPISLEDPNIRKKLEKRIDKWSTRILNNIIIKQFPTSHLTVGQLRAYMDNIENTQRFIPDLVLIDYPDLMKIDRKNYRLEIDGIYTEIRGIGVERNMAMAVVSQSHRGAAKAKTVEADNVAEAYSKIAHSDVTMTLSQTKAEEALKLARLKVAAGRNDNDNLTMVLSQNFDMGQFVVDSAVMRGNYFNLLPQSPEEELD